MLSQKIFLFQQANETWCKEKKTLKAGSKLSLLSIHLSLSSEATFQDRNYLKSKEAWRIWVKVLWHQESKENQ